jgi:four helix bundle protein
LGFDAHDAARELIDSLHGPLVAIAQHDQDLSRQLRRAAPSVLFNIGEGSRRTGKDRLHHYRVAAGSAAEVSDGLFVARSWNYVDGSQLEKPLELLDRIAAMLWKLTH